jgi:putative hemolysin
MARVNIDNFHAQPKMQLDVGPHAQTTTPKIYGQIGTLITRLAQNSREVDAAQALRFQVFVEEMNAKVPAEAMRRRRDFDAWDGICDHLLVLDTAIEGDPEDQVVGTYRLLLQEKAAASHGFYTSSEFDVRALIARHPDKRFMEIGRSCVLPEYRTRRTVELLWQGTWGYATDHKIDAMIGCASFAGADPNSHAQALAFLHHHACAVGEWLAGPLQSLYQDMDLMELDRIDARAAIAEMPPLIKAYLRIGAKFGNGAVVDQAFNTTDVLVILPVESIADRYVNYYSAGLARRAA